uniref:Large ribosomal subunit protein eL14 n=1 Tax=Panagrolaimus sp. JU765 TaxID=591449 RepID=A0AC34QQ96_9BILA
MIFNKFVEIGRVVYISNGPNKGKLAVVANVVDASKLLVDGPSSGVARSIISYQDVQLTKFTVPIRVGQRSGNIKKAYDEADINTKWSQTGWAKRDAAKKIRAGLNDFQRYKVQKLKQCRNRAIRNEAAKIRKAAKKA